MLKNRDAPIRYLEHLDIGPNMDKTAGSDIRRTTVADPLPPTYDHDCNSNNPVH